VRNFEMAQICPNIVRKGIYGVLESGFAWLESIFLTRTFDLKFGGLRSLGSEHPVLYIAQRATVCRSTARENVYGVEFYCGPACAL